MQKEWYVVNTYSGHENKVKEKLEMRANSMGLEDYIFRVVVPEEKVVDEKGKEKNKCIKNNSHNFIGVSSYNCNTSRN